MRRGNAKGEGMEGETPPGGSIPLRVQLDIMRALNALRVRVIGEIDLYQTGNRVEIIIDGKSYGAWDIKKGTFCR